MAALITAAPTCAELLPPTAAVFFQHPTVTRPSSLQRTLTQQATAHTYEASLQRAKDAKKTDDARLLAHLTSVSAPRAWTWKCVVPTSRELELTDVQYRLAARLNLGLPPVDGIALGAQPPTCPLCAHVRNTRPSIRDDPWHFLTCKMLSKGEVNARHNDVAEQVSRCSTMLGIRARREVTGLSEDATLQPDLLLSLPGKTVLSDVAVCHPLAPGTRGKTGMSTLGTARHREADKRRKYLALSSSTASSNCPSRSRRRAAWGRRP